MVQVLRTIRARAGMDYIFPSNLTGFRNTMGAYGQDVTFDRIAISCNTCDAEGDLYTRYEILQVHMS